MTQKTFIVTSLAILVLVGYLVLSAFRTTPNLDYSSSTVVFKKTGDIVQVYVPKNQKASTLGLGGRTVLPEDYGMLWSFPQATKPTFTMLGMKLPLDFIWIREDKVAEITANVPASRLDLLQSSADVTEVLEVNAGYAARHEVKVGDEVEISQAWSE